MAIDNQRRKRYRVTRGVDGENISDKTSLKDCGQLFKEIDYK